MLAKERWWFNRSHLFEITRQEPMVMGSCHARDFVARDFYKAYKFVKAF